jgi:hypothetical protein
MNSNACTSGITHTHLHRNFVVSMPVVVKGIRADRSEYSYKAHIAVDKFGLHANELPLRLKSPERYEHVKAHAPGRDARGRCHL